MRIKQLEKNLESINNKNTSNAYQTKDTKYH